MNSLFRLIKDDLVLDIASQCWTKGQRSTAVAEDIRTLAKTTVAEAWGDSYSHRSFL